MIKHMEATKEALHVIALLRKKYGELLFYQSGGCCDGSIPMCYPKNELTIGTQDILLGYIEGSPYYIHKKHVYQYRNTELTIDVTPGKSGMFSIEGTLGVRFISKLKIAKGKSNK